MYLSVRVSVGNSWQPQLRIFSEGTIYRGMNKTEGTHKMLSDLGGSNSKKLISLLSTWRRKKRKMESLSLAESCGREIKATMLRVTALPAPHWGRETVVGKTYSDPQESLISWCQPEIRGKEFQVMQSIGQPSRANSNTEGLRMDLRTRGG